MEQKYKDLIFYNDVCKDAILKFAPAQLLET